MYYVYMLRCRDNSLYTGITTDLNRRFLEHFNKGEKCAKYTAFHDVVGIEVAFLARDRSLASKLEYAIKKLSKAKKEGIISGKLSLECVFGNKINTLEYKRYEGGRYEK